MRPTQTLVRMPRFAFQESTADPQRMTGQMTGQRLCRIVLPFVYTILTSSHPYVVACLAYYEVEMSGMTTLHEEDRRYGRISDTKGTGSAPLYNIYRIHDSSWNSVGLSLGLGYQIVNPPGQKENDERKPHEPAEKSTSDEHTCLSCRRHFIEPLV